MKVPNRIGRYYVENELGNGSFGTVYKAFDPRTKRVVAIKVLRESLHEFRDRDEIEEDHTRFKTEWEAVGKLRHPNIVIVHDVGEYEGGPFMVMEYVPGEDLKRVFKKGKRLPIRKSLRIMDQLLAALEHSHKNDVVHRDIKPSNIILSSNENLTNEHITVIDFGIARLPESTLTKDGRAPGTPAYMSPEQLNSRRDLDGRTDIFSAGVIFYELLTGAHPFGPVADDGYVHRVLNDVPTPPSKKAGAVPSAFDSVSLKALARDRKDRYATAGEFAQALRTLAPAHDCADFEGEESDDHEIPSPQRAWPQSVDVYICIGIIFLIIGYCMAYWMI
ncbi:MAG: serine/threonine protein kinase [Rhodocyclaceae bacterium]|nr:serine/threonine protein kinase [Rhodocyclaceae bacterium]MBX3668269.1 serine/threonine protein kinase [Rhodocyclaceae bacterium]